MDREPNNSKLQEKVLAKIRAREVVMRPRLYFVFKMAAAAVVALCVLALSVSVLSYVFFCIRESSEGSLLRFGPPGWLIFITLFPWWLLALDVALVALLQWMLHAFRYSYRIPLLYLWGGLLALVLACSLIIDLAHFNDDVLLGARHYGVPFAGELYERGMHPPPPGSGACPCVVDSINGDTLTMHEENTPGEAPVPAPDEIKVLLPAGIASSSIHVGEHVFVVGRYQDGVLYAQGLEQRDHDIDDSGI